MKVYHIVYEPDFNSLILHFWTKCNLKCRCCYCQFEKYDFGTIDDPIGQIANKPPVEPPTRFLSFEEVMEIIKDLEIKVAVFVGTEASLDPELPRLAKALHQKFSCHNILLTNGVVLMDMEHIDEIIFSIKAVSEDLHKDYTGKPNKEVLENFTKIYKTGKKMQAETVLIPEYIDAFEVEKTARFVASVDPDITLRVDAYFPGPGCPWRAATKEEVEEAAELARKHVKKVSCLTLDMKRIGEKAKQLF